MQNQLTITLTINDAGEESLNVNGPIANKTLCYGMLERARDAIQAFDPTKQSGLVVPQNGGRFVP